MQTIARANRVYDDEKTIGLIADYGNVYKQLEEAYSVYGEGSSGTSKEGEKPTKNIDELVYELKNSITEIKEYLLRLEFNIEKLYRANPIEKLKLLIVIFLN